VCGVCCPHLPMAGSDRKAHRRRNAVVVEPAAAAHGRVNECGVSEGGAWPAVQLGEGSRVGFNEQPAESEAALEHVAVAQKHPVERACIAASSGWRATVCELDRTE
jgi:hypothetical protein